MFLSLSCSYGVVKINSFPREAQVSILKGNGELNSIGATPYEGPRNSLFSSGSSSSYLRISKDGYQTKELLVTGPESSQNVDLLISLAKDSETKSANIPTPLDIERYSKLLLKSNRLIQSKKFDEAQIVLDQLILNYPSTSAPYDLKANVYYLQHNYSKAIENYQQSVSINPENRESSLMIEKIKTLLK